jgi:hypothetical protein
MINTKHRSSFLLIVIMMLIGFRQVVSGQQITFAPIQSQDKSNMEFEIIGKVSGNYLVYKHYSQKHWLCRYDNQMQLTETVSLDFLPDKLFNIDFIRTGQTITAVFQEQKNNQVYCGAAKLMANGTLLGSIIYLDTAQIGYFANNRIFGLSVCEDKTKWLIYRKQTRNDEMELRGKLFDTSIQLMDAFVYGDDFENRRDNLTEPIVTNQGLILFCREKRKYTGDHFNKTTLYWHRPNENGFGAADLPLQDWYTMGAFIKIDHTNRKAVITSFYLAERDDKPRGLFCLRFDLTHCELGQSRFNELTEDQTNQLKNENNQRNTWKSLLPNQLLVRKDGSFLLLTESFFTQTWNNNAWNQNNFMFNNPGMVPMNDVGFFNPYYNMYRPWGFNNNQQTRYYYNDILALSVDSLLQLEWTTELNKSQMDIDNDHYLSFGFLNSGSALHFFYLNPDRQKSAILHQGLSSDGIFQLQPTFYGPEENYFFMPRLSKQVGVRQLLVPFQFRGKIGFARIDL